MSSSTVSAYHVLPPAPPLVGQAGATVAVVAILQFALFFLVVFLWNRQRREYLFFFVQFLGGAAYPAFWLGVLTPVVGRADGLVVAAALVIAPVAAVKVTHHYFALEPTRCCSLVRSMTSGCSVCSRRAASRIPARRRFVRSEPDA